jgi:hypothetical protein
VIEAHADRLERLARQQTGVTFAVADDGRGLEVQVPLADSGAAVRARVTEKEVRFYWRATPALLPVWWDGQLRIVRWGNRDRAERKLPPTGWTWQESIEEGKWAMLAPEPVVIPASFGLMHGVWFKVKQGMQGLLVLGETHSFGEEIA